MAKASIVQIVIQIEGRKGFYAVSLPKDRLDLLVGFIADMSDGPIKVVELPGVEMIPIEKVQEPSV